MESNKLTQDQIEDIVNKNGERYKRVSPAGGAQDTNLTQTLTIQQSQVNNTAVQV